MGICNQKDQRQSSLCCYFLRFPAHHRRLCTAGSCKHGVVDVYSRHMSPPAVECHSCSFASQHGGLQSATSVKHCVVFRCASFGKPAFFLCPRSVVQSADS